MSSSCLLDWCVWFTTFVLLTQKSVSLYPSLGKQTNTKVSKARRHLSERHSDLTFAMQTHHANFNIILPHLKFVVKLCLRWTPHSSVSLCLCVLKAMRDIAHFSYYHINGEWKEWLTTKMHFLSANIVLFCISCPHLYFFLCAFSACSYSYVLSTCDLSGFTSQNKLCTRVAPVSVVHWRWDTCL